MAICTKCHEDKPQVRFSKNKACKSGHINVCYECVQEMYWANLKTKEGPEGILSHVVRGARSRAKRDGKEHDLTTSELMEIFKDQNGRCALSGREMTWEYGNGFTLNNVSIDRLDITRGYTKSNVQLVCRIVNVARNVMEVPEFLKLCREIADYNAG